MSEVRQIEITEGINSWGQGSFNAVRAATKGYKGSKIRVVVNSFGGSVLEGLMIHNYLKGHPAEVEVHVPAYAMSAATIIAAAGDRVTMSDTGYFMIHNPWTFAMGDQNVMEDTRALLQMFTDDMANIYAKRTGLDVSTIKDMMDAETWLTSQQALEMGFVDELTVGAKFEASLPAELLATLNNVPQALLPVNNKPEPIMSETKTLWEKLGALFAGAGTVTDPALLLTENETRLMKAAETATQDADASRQALTELQATHSALTVERDQAIADLATANARIAELEALPAATHTEGRTDGDLPPNAETKPWMNNPVYLKARRAAGIEK